MLAHLKTFVCSSAVEALSTTKIFIETCSHTIDLLTVLTILTVLTVRAVLTVSTVLNVWTVLTVWTVMAMWTVLTVWSEMTENLKKYDLLTYSLTDNLKARDASASKN